MPHFEEGDKGENYDFRWGKKIGEGGKNKDCVLYESFTFDGTEYLLYDCVYLYKEGEPEPYIGKLVKIWEQPSQRKGIKVVWFFRPIELRNWLGDIVPLKNEIFLACGKGKGLSNLNPLEAIIGKCNVICTSKDKRNEKPPDEELRISDYVFYRTFNVGNYTISDKMEDAIAGIEVRYFFNKKWGQIPSGVPKVTHLKDDEGKMDSPNGVPKVQVLSLSKGADVEPFSGQQSKPRENTGFAEDEVKSRILVSQFEDEDNGKSTKRSAGSGVLGNIPSKKSRLNDPSAKWSEESTHTKGLKRSVETRFIESEDKTKTSIVKWSVVQDQGSFKKVKLDEHLSKPSVGTLYKASPAVVGKSIKIDAQMPEVTGQHVVDKSKWFKKLPLTWEERMQAAHGQERLVILENVDPEYTSTEIEDIIWQGFNEKCYARVIQRTLFSSPHSGRAIVIFESKEAAETALTKLDRGCLMLPNGRPLVGGRGTPRVPEKPVKFNGHLTIDNYKVKLRMRESMKSAVSTSHSSQPNTIEYEMAMEWRLLQTKSDLWWKELYKRQGMELEELKMQLKNK